MLILSLDTIELITWIFKISVQVGSHFRTHNARWNLLQLRIVFVYAVFVFVRIYERNKKPKSRFFIFKNCSFMNN
jgi:uncharacterized membrane protein SirB2